MIQVEWIEPVYKEFITRAGLTAAELSVMELHHRRVPDIEVAYALNMSPRTVQRLIKSCKNKYDLLQPHSDILPPRRISGP